MATFKSSPGSTFQTENKEFEKFIAPNCEGHSDMVIQFWCITCKTRVCFTCFEEGHDEHSLKPFKKYLKEEVAFHLEVSDVKLQSLYERAGKLISRFDDRIKKSKEQKAYLLDERRKIDSLKGDLPKLKNFSKDPKFNVSLNMVESAMKQWNGIDTLQEVVSVAEKEFRIEPPKQVNEEQVLKLSKIKTVPQNQSGRYCNYCGNYSNANGGNDDSDTLYHKNHSFTIQLFLQNMQFRYVITRKPVDNRPRRFSFSGSVEIKCLNAPNLQKKSFPFQVSGNNTTSITAQELNFFNLSSLGYSYGYQMSIDVELKFQN